MLRLNYLTYQVIIPAVMASNLAVAQEQGAAKDSSRDLNKVDSVLDRLEKRLLDQDADGLTFGERQNDPAFLKHPEEAPTKTYRFEGSKVEASTPEKNQLKAVTTLVTELELQVDQLASNVQKTKQSIVDEAAIDNFVSIDAQLLETDSAAIKTLNVKLDGYEVYALADASGLWLPAKSVPLYAGPLQPGTHRLDLEVRLVLRHNAQLPMNGDVYRFINKSFDLTITGGTSNTRYIIAIKPPEKFEGSADATIKEAI